MSNVRQEREAARRAEAARALQQAREGGGMLDSALAAPIERAVAHFRADDAPPDPIEVWGRRIGRGIALVVVIGLIVYLVGQIRGGLAP